MESSDDQASPAPQTVVRTVLGPVYPGALGPTLMHEHLLIRNPSFVEPTDPVARERAYQPVHLDNLGWVRRYWTSSADNLVLDDESLAAAELGPFVAAGGRTVVDATVPGIGRDPQALARISRGARTGAVSQAAVYAATKAGLIALTKNVARNYGPDGVTVNAVAPGGIDTPMVAGQGEVTPGFRKRVTAQIPLGRFADPAEVAAVVAFLASDGASFVTGATIDVNGGWFMY